MTIPTANLEQAKAWVVAADLIQQIVQLPLDPLFQRFVGRQILTIRKIPNPDRFSGVHKRVTKLHKLRRSHTRLGLAKYKTIANLNARMIGCDTLAALDNRHETSPCGRSARE